MTTTLSRQADSGVEGPPYTLHQWVGRIVRPKLRLRELLFGADWDAVSARLEAEAITESVHRAVELLDDTPDIAADQLGGCELGLVSVELASLYHSEFHYLASPRPEGVHLGLHAPGQPPACVLSFAPFDLDHLTPQLPAGIRPDQILVLTRQVTVGNAPRNTWSYTFARACRWLRAHRPATRLLITYLDPNLGFAGASYLAANWSYFGDERKGRYVFVDGVPVTNRELVARYGTARYDDLAERLGGRVRRTDCPLVPLKLLMFPLDRRRPRPPVTGGQAT